MPQTPLEARSVAASAPDTDQLLNRASKGDGAARQQLLTRHRQRLRKMIALRLDRRLAARVDPSDVVQETLAKADQQLAAYLRTRPLPFYPWLRQFAEGRLAKLHRRHLRASKRNARREEPGILNLPDESALELAGRLLARDSSPSRQLLREELRERVRAGLAQLGARDREVLVLRYLEQLSTKETAHGAGNHGRRGESPAPAGAGTAAEPLGRRPGGTMTTNLTADRSRTGAGSEVVLAELLEELANRVQADDPATAEEFLQRIPNTPTGCAGCCRPPRSWPSCHAPDQRL